jgi:hypothetical protein
VRKENIPYGSLTDEQRRQPALAAKTLRAAGLLIFGFIVESVAARRGDWPVRLAPPPAPPRPKSKSPAAVPLPIFRQSLKEGWAPFFISLCALAFVHCANAAGPNLSITLISPGVLQISWPTNYPGEQLQFATSLSPSNWQNLPQPPIPSDAGFVALVATDDAVRYFRLVPFDASCVFHATPSIINPGASSTLSWCPVTGVTYQLAPGGGTVSGGSVVVSPAVTTVYSLIATSASGTATNTAAVIVSPCGFAGVTDMDASLGVTYGFHAQGSGYNITCSRFTVANFHLTQTSNTNGDVQFMGSLVPGPAQDPSVAYVNDEEDETSGGQTYVTRIKGRGPPASGSFLILDINCGTGTYTFSALVQLNATIFFPTGSSAPQVSNIGLLVVGPHPLMDTDGLLDGTEILPARGFTWFSGGDYYTPNDQIPNDMWYYGLVTDYTAGKAPCVWTFTPSP